MKFWNVQCNTRELIRDKRSNALRACTRSRGFCINREFQDEPEVHTLRFGIRETISTSPGETIPADYVYGYRTGLIVSTCGKKTVESVETDVSHSRKLSPRKLRSSSTRVDRVGIQLGHVLFQQSRGPTRINSARKSAEFYEWTCLYLYIYPIPLNFYAGESNTRLDANLHWRRVGRRETDGMGIRCEGNYGCWRFGKYGGVLYGISDSKFVFFIYFLNFSSVRNRQKYVKYPKIKININFHFVRYICKNRIL